MAERDRSGTILRVCEALGEGNNEDAAEILSAEYPFAPRSAFRKSFSHAQRLRVFMRDGFIDRYSGKRLVYPPVLAVLHHHLPRQFPSHRNWKMSESHIAYWELSPILDHVHPVALGGPNDESNIVTTSGVHNAMKAQYTLEELGWELHPPGDLQEWDGLLEWAVSYCEKNSWILDRKHPAGSPRPWHKAALELLPL